MARHQVGGNAVLRTIFIVGFSLLLLFGSAMDVRRFLHPIGVFGYGTNLDGVVTGVNAGSPASQAGIQVGDRLDESSMSPQDLWNLIQVPVMPSAGMTRSFGVYHGGVRRSVSLKSAPEPMGVVDESLILVALVASVVFVAIGAALVLLRPTAVTWGFYFFSIAFAPSGWLLTGMTEVFATALSPYGQILFILHGGVIFSAGWVGLLVFSLHFLQGPIGGWRLRVQRALPFLFISLAGLQTLYIVNAYFLGRPGEMLARAGIALAALCAVVVFFALIDTYMHRPGAERQRIQWVVFGFALALITSLAGQILTVEVTNAPLSVSYGLSLLNIVAPIAVAYAIVKHRVIDVGFVISRTLVYGILTSVLIGGFALIDWLFIDKLKLARLGTIAEMGFAVAGGFWLNSLHRRVDWLIDATFFRQRHRAEVQLARNAAALQFATSEATVAKVLVDETVRALALASGALFRRRSDGVYVRDRFEGWRPADIARLSDEDDHLLMLLQAEKGPVSVYDHRWRAEGVPPGAARPGLALPIIVRRELAAVVFYGSHVQGESLDPDEIKAIAGLAIGAAAAYDHLEAQATKQATESLKDEVELLRTQLAEARIQPA
jgi:hypothetical protein